MVKETIKIFARVKPTKNKIGAYNITENENGDVIAFNVPREASDGWINNKKEEYKFLFENLFDQKTRQEDVFEHVSKPVIENVLSGYNGTIFAYGQTGSGKTFTITGGPERFEDRGLIPRSLSYIFQKCQQQTEYEYSVHVSYLEIYNENGFDLLNPNHDITQLEDLPRVTLLEDADQVIHLRNLSVQPAANEEEALNLLFLGDTNRMIAETPMNQASTRSHCIFTIHVTGKEIGSAKIRRSRLNLVDLAGSERVGKSNINGTLLQEAKYINLSLHYLEQVIVALSEKNRAHIPYRNSMMTSVLRDSLGGNCMTTMIATLSAEMKNIDESISTCRFAQRVAMIKNDAILNEEIDPQMLINRLKRENQELKNQLTVVQGEPLTDPLTEAEAQECKAKVDAFLDDNDPEGRIDVGSDLRKVALCFTILKGYIRDVTRELDKRSKYVAPAPEATAGAAYDSKEVEQLKLLLVQRDNEINILVKMLKKEKQKNAADAAGGTHTQYRDYEDTSSQRSSGSERNLLESREMRPSPQTSSPDERPPVQMGKKKPAAEKRAVLRDLSLGRQEAFEIFRRDYPENRKIVGHQEELKHKYALAKSLGEQYNQSKKRVNQIKAEIEKLRLAAAMEGRTTEEDPREVTLKQQMEDERRKYKDCYNRIKDVKMEIEHIQHFLDQLKVRCQKDFESWWAEQVAVLEKEKALVNMDSTARRKGMNAPLQPISARDELASQASSTRSSVRSSVVSDKTFVRSSETPGSSSSSIPMTGDEETDADIRAFIESRQKIFAVRQQQRKT